MDRQRFDALAKALTAGGSRRAAIGSLLGALGLMAGLDDEGADAHDSSKRCKNVPDKKKRKKCVKKGKAHKKWHETNACRGEGQVCGSRPCCNSLVCTDGTCEAESV